MSPKIKLSSLDHTYGSTMRIQEVVFTELPAENFLTENRELIIARTLEVFNFKKKVQWDDTADLEKACVKVLTATTWYKNGKMDPGLGEDKGIYDPLAHYFKHILGLFKMPANEFRHLESMVRADLKAILTLIERYETQEPVIQAYLNTGEKRGEHEGKVRLDFYFRCLKERDKIVAHLVSGVAERAVYKARTDKEWIGFLPPMWREQNDRPYRWWQPRSERYFDYKQIDTCLHRLLPVAIRIGRKMASTYHAGGQLSFYKQLKKLLPPKKIFEQIQRVHIPANPKVRERSAIFVELEYLFRSRRWYGFTALALTQVEGIFSDMVNIINPSARLSSLPNKVFAIRGYYDYHESSFDYFEYVLPRIRNRFLHSGSAGGQNFQVLAYDLLYDLEYLLQIFLELKDDQVRLTKMFNGNMLVELAKLEDLLDVFQMIEKLKEKLRKNPGAKELTELLAKWEQFEAGTLKKEGLIELYADQFIKELSVKTNKFFEAVYNYTTYSSQQLDLLSLTGKEVKEQLPVIDQILKRDMYHFDTQFTEINNMHTFLKQYQRSLPNIKKETDDKLKALKQVEKTAMRAAKIEILAPLFD